MMNGKSTMSDHSNSPDPKENGSLPPIEKQDTNGDIEFRPANKEKPPEGYTNNGYQKTEPAEEKEKDEKDKEEEEKKEKPKTVSLKQLFRYASCGDICLIFLGIFCAIVNGVAMPAMIIVFGDMLDSFIVDGSTQNELQALPWDKSGYTMDQALADQDIMEKAMAKMNMSDQYNAMQEKVMSDLLGQIEMFAIYYVIIGCCVLVAAYGQVTCLLLASFRQTQKIRLLLFDSILRQDIGWYDTHETGELNTRLSDDVTKIQEGLGEKNANFFQWIAGCIAGVIIGFVYGWKLTLVIFAISPLIAAGGAFMAVLTSKATTQELDAYAKAGSVAEEVLGAVRTVFAFGGQKKEVDRYTGNLQDAKKSGVKKAFVSGFGMGILYLCMFASYALAFWYGSKLVREEPDNYTPGTMLIVFFSIIIAAMALGNAFPNIRASSEAQGAAYIVWNIIDRVPPIDSKSDAGDIPGDIQGTIRFTDVHFEYPSRPDAKVLQGLTLEVSPGQTAALVGSSGCGKSTTVQLIQRFYDPSSGSVSIDGKDIKDLNLKWLRQHIGVVSQEPILFGTTIRENIRYGRDGVSDADIENAAKNANAHNFISELPKDYDTLVGERGAQLSGGQKQRIAIARALVRDPKILLLDEATSALDTESEATVQEALDKAREGRTTLVIAHRLSTIQNADIIFGIKEGKVAEQGSHDQLMAQGGIYKELVMNQSGLDDMDDAADFDVVPLEETKIAMAHRSSNRKMSRSMSTVSKKSTGKTADDDEDFPEVGMGRILAMNASEWYLMVIGCIAAIGNGAILPAFAIVFSEILGVFTIVDEEEKKDKIFFYSMMFLVIGIVAAVSMLLQGLMFGLSGETLTMRLRSYMFESLMKQEVAYFDDHRNNVGALTTRLATDASAVQGATGHRLGMMCQSLASIGTGIVIGFIFSWKLTLVILLFLPFLGLASFLQMKVMQGYSGANQTALEGAGKIAVESIENIRTVVSLTKEPKFYEDYKGKTDPQYRASMKKAHVYGITFSFSQALIYFAYAASFYFGAWLVKNDGLSFENMIKVFSAVVFGAMAMGEASHFAPDYGKAKTAASRIFFLFDREPVINNMSDEGTTPPGTATGAVRLQDVDFCYPTRPSIRVANQLSIEANPGETVALVGSSGCGKSTCIQLILRFYDPEQGQVFLDNTGLTDLNLQWVRRQIGIVQQEPILFDCSIKDNIAYGDNEREVSMDEIIAAARKANIHEFIAALPDGYDTNVGDKGAQLSGGQKQRVAIARALVRNPVILLLDEATSALDTESEKVVQEALDKAREGRTCIMIAHRLSTVHHADRIVVIRAGRVMEQGTHSQLLAQNGLYTKLHNAQKRK